MLPYRRGTGRLLVGVWLIGSGLDALTAGVWSPGVSCRQMPSAGPMIPMCDDQETQEPARAQATRQGGGRARGYPSDLSDAQWQVIAPHLPAQRLGRPVDETYH